jgi:ribosomal protein S3
VYGDFLVEDQRVREHIDRKLNRQPPYAAVSKVEIERSRNEVKVILHTARPGLVIGPKGAEVDKLKGDLAQELQRAAYIKEKLEKDKASLEKAKEVTKTLAGVKEARWKEKSKWERYLEELAEKSAKVFASQLRGWVVR